MTSAALAAAREREGSAAAARLLARLRPDAARLVKVAAISGPSFSIEVLSEVVGEPVGALLPLIEEAVGAEVLAVYPTAVEFCHDSMREALYDEVPEPLRRALHRQIGTSLLGRGGFAVSAAAHLLEGASQGDWVTLACLDDAAAEVLKTSPEAAADLASRALALTEPADEHRLARAMTAVDALVRAQRFGEAAALARSVLVDPALDGDARAQLRLTLSSIFFARGLPAEAAAEADLVLAAPDLDDTLYTGAELSRLLALLAQDDLAAARRRAEAILAGEPPSRGDAALAGALVVLSLLAWRQGRVADALSLLRAAVERADRGPVEGRGVHPDLCLAAKLTAIGDFDEAERAVAHAALGISATGDSVWAAAPEVFRARVCLASGRLAEAKTCAEAGLAQAEATGCRFLLPMALSVLASVALHRGDLGEAAEFLARCQSEAPSTHPLFAPTTYAWVQSQIAEAQGDRDRALQALANGSRESADYTPLLVDESAAAASAVRLALAAGERRRAEAVVACAERLAAGPGDGDSCPSLIASADHARGLLERDPDLVKRAAAAHRHPWAGASAIEDAGTVLAERSDITAAVPCWERALDGYERCGAARDASRVRARLREAGVRRRHWRRTVRPVSGWASLTEGELRVAELAAQGLTNSQVGERRFVSRHTVDFHLRQIFRKLDISSRVELTRVVIENSAVPRPSSA